ncbi:heme biosynthesis HemY N-terminal domain-containing protein [Acidiphilium iwatense]|uniref:Heme biosynthesis protein HemY n=1 Tax=Acidiphilium iwatense TaxID=768198 RepID=A0ABS9DRU7_9PROT|nr:heme biosynthesis HemY N-terminal domain-containing protein [Acidiphilium iwatense]MCF3945384.1 heme biosynthesis protein HemY [Acidiphilium iwatense]
MLRAFRFAIVAIVLLGIAWYVATLPGHVTLDFGGYSATASTPVAIILLVVLAGIVMLILAIIRALVRAPGRLAARRALAWRNAADSASLRALSALAAGDVRAAGSHARIAQRHAPDAPLTLYVAGETARRDGDHAIADAHFTALARHKDAGFLGWRGLLHHRTQNLADAATLAEAEAQARQAAGAYPNSAWLRDRRVQLAMGQGRFAEAARLATGKPEHAALAIMASRDAETARLAIDWAKEAVRAAPGLAPAYLALFQSHERAGHPWRAKRALLRGWKAAPHPDLATAWLARITAPLERARAAHKLASANPGHPESEALLARTAKAAGLEGEAKRHEMLAADAAGIGWVCAACETPHEEWQATCRKCGMIGSLTWVKAQPAIGVTARLPAPPPGVNGGAAA